jgi:hypothetical protein
MKWTKERPKAYGFYWVKFYGTDEVDLVYISKKRSISYSSCLDINTEKAQFAGPIQEPED